MASLQSSCMVLTHNRICPLVKPSHHFPNARLTYRFHVSCSSNGGVDRRNMLLGLGGLYGAANLISDSKAYADPIQPPDIKSCGVADVHGDPLDVNCCPPNSDTIIDYELPSVTSLRVRPAAHKLNHGYLTKYEKAIQLMRELDKKDPSDPRGFTQQANVHCAYCNGAYDQVDYEGTDISIHYSWLFFPFHRWYLYFYERILGSLIGDPTFALPFWNWDNPRGMQLPAIFDNPHSPLYDINRNPSNRPPAIVDLALSGKTDDEQLVRSNLSTMYKEMLSSVDDTNGFMGQPYCAGMTPPGSASGGTVERGSHTSVHRWVGHPDNKYHEDLGNFYSAGRDPAFYSHHSNVDRMWTIWKHLKTKVPKDINKPDYLNASFLFYDENQKLVRVKVADALDNRKMGYDYEKVEMPWMYYRPPRRSARVRIQDISKGAENPEKVFPLSLNRIVRVLISKRSPGKVDEVLVLEDIHTDPTEFVKFDIYVNDEDDEPKDVDKAEYAGTFSQLPHRVHHSNRHKGSMKLSLKELYEDIDIHEDDTTVVVTLVPRANGHRVTIAGIKIVKSRSSA
ncbi:polyphenol oxidase I, chloroplastic-like [Salvia miltiorrhiza]|uniref:polyphenol oxidase I, chloroplastic-like n=1 Tax=Salvia miltiorrhiza TaxID=226208 RepID=UPI0025AD4B4B|nr:polyphenol oxidase I, chloroplastic-like [Salvia miltiorrhiza]